MIDALTQGAPAFAFIGEVRMTKRISLRIKQLYQPAHLNRVDKPWGKVQLLTFLTIQYDGGGVAS